MENKTACHHHRWLKMCTYCSPLVESCSQALWHQATVPLAERTNYFQPIVVVNVSSWCGRCCQYTMCWADNDVGLKQGSPTKRSGSRLSECACVFSFRVESCVFCSGECCSIDADIDPGDTHSCGWTAVRGLGGIIWVQVESEGIRGNQPVNIQSITKYPQCHTMHIQMF